MSEYPRGVDSLNPFPGVSSCIPVFAVITPTSIQMLKTAFCLF